MGDYMVPYHELFSLHPQVNYVKTIDQYLIGCFLFVFATLAEYSLVLFLAARMKRYQQTEEYKVDQHKQMKSDPSNIKLLGNGEGPSNKVCILLLCIVLVVICFLIK